jgi:hypothetical protein
VSTFVPQFKPSGIQHSAGVGRIINDSSFSHYDNAIDERVDAFKSMFHNDRSK